MRKGVRRSRKRRGRAKKPSGWCRFFGSANGLPFGEWLKRVWKAVLADQCDDLAAQLSYFFVLAMFPFFVVLAAIVGFLPFTGLWPHVLTWITHSFPDNVQPYVFRTVSKLTEESFGLLSFGLATCVWIATRGVVSLMDGLNQAYGAPETRPFWKRRLISCGVMLVFAVTFVTAFALLTFGGRFGHWLAVRTGWGIAFILVWHLSRWAISLTLLNLTVQFANHALPNRRHDWRWYTPGSLFVVAVWFPSTMGFNTFLRHSSATTSAYGALGTFFVLMAWVWITNFILLVGAEMDSEFEKASLPARDPAPPALIAR